MAIVSLLRLPSAPRERWAFVFEHNMAHRKQNPVTTYLLDPMRFVERPGSKWHLDHQQAHNAMAQGPPPIFGAILRDSNLSNQRQKKWWEFLNHQEHFLHQ